MLWFRLKKLEFFSRAGAILVARLSEAVIFLFDLGNGAGGRYNMRYDCPPNDKQVACAGPCGEQFFPPQEDSGKMPRRGW